MLEHAEAAEFGGRPIRLPKRLNANSPPMLVLLVNEGTASTSDPLDALFAEALEAVASGQPMYWLRLERPQRVPSAPGGRVVKTHELNLINMCYLEDGKVVEGVTEFCMQVACEDMASPSSIFVSFFIQPAGTETSHLTCNIFRTVPWCHIYGTPP